MQTPWDEDDERLSTTGSLTCNHLAGSMSEMVQLHDPIASSHTVTLQPEEDWKRIMSLHIDKLFLHPGVEIYSSLWRLLLPLTR